MHLFQFAHYILLHDGKIVNF